MSESRLECFNNGELFVLTEAISKLNIDYYTICVSAESEHNVILKNLYREIVDEYHRRMGK